MTIETETATHTENARATVARNRKPRQSAPVPHDINAAVVPWDSAPTAEVAHTDPRLQGAAEVPAAPDASASKQPAKSLTVLKLLRRKRGATIAELMDATGWQAHSVRGFLSGTVKKRMGLEVTSEVGADGIRRYSVAKA